ncbi:hypothetical protein BS50DRAFT_302939 [Corynespora cassiicola Philippines]|uniref:F-box domain-containing protein n=1 Tax=Corynespora cassiicola Philippines TaxID=1448308 RepID=A0A2T2NX90_CORCC|nr:hypothetical protein BS50DRAFT_302939 [Corynespora cassiicola Philippines]
MHTSNAHGLVVPVLATPPAKPQYANYLPDELLLEILAYFPRNKDSQATLAKFCLVNRQWYDVAIPYLYESPYLAGSAYDLFVRTLCPSVIAHIKFSPLAGLVKILDLSHIVHQSTKSTTARLLGRTKHNLEVFVAPQASFAINCWASLSKCARLRVLDLSLVSECINYQNLNQTIRKLPELTDLYLPRCSSTYENPQNATNIQWPTRLAHLSLSGSVHGPFLWDMTRQPDTFPPTLSSISICHCPSLSRTGVKDLLRNVKDTITTAELRDLPLIRQGSFDGILNWLPHCRRLTIALDYISDDFGRMPDDFSPAHWAEAKPLEYLSLVTSGQRDVDPTAAFAAEDLYMLIDERFLGRLRWLKIAQSSGWKHKESGAEVEALEMLIVESLDKENWENRRWHYEGLTGVPEGMKYEEWKETSKGKAMAPWVRMLRHQ